MRSMCEEEKEELDNHSSDAFRVELTLIVFVDFLVSLSLCAGQSPYDYYDYRGITQHC